MSSIDIVIGIGRWAQAFDGNSSQGFVHGISERYLALLLVALNTINYQKNNDYLCFLVLPQGAVCYSVRGASKLFLRRTALFFAEDGEVEIDTDFGVEGVERDFTHRHRMDPDAAKNTDIVAQRVEMVVQHHEAG